MCRRARETLAGWGGSRTSNTASPGSGSRSGPTLTCHSVRSTHVRCRVARPRRHILDPCRVLVTHLRRSRRCLRSGDDRVDGLLQRAGLRRPAGRLLLRREHVGARSPGGLLAAQTLADLGEPLLLLLVHVVPDVLDQHGRLRREALVRRASSPPARRPARRRRGAPRRTPARRPRARAAARARAGTSPRSRCRCAP